MGGIDGALEGEEGLPTSSELFSLIPWHLNSLSRLHSPSLYFNSINTNRVLNKPPPPSLVFLPRLSAFYFHVFFDTLEERLIVLKYMTRDIFQKSL